MGAGDHIAPAKFSCSCGGLTGQIEAATPKSGTHLECYCKDCRAAQIFLGQPDPAPRGVHLFQTTPDRVTILTGADNLGLLRLSPNGLMRWYATCCNAPLFNTLASPRLPFVGVIVDRLKNPAQVGPVITHSFVPDPQGGRPRHKGATVMAWRFLIRLIAARLSGHWRHTPFFDVKTGEPTAVPRILGKDERTAATPK